jgi:hypothetical protein
MRGRNAALRNATKGCYDTWQSHYDTRAELATKTKTKTKNQKKRLLTSRSGAQSLKPKSNIIEKITTILNTLL